MSATPVRVRAAHLGPERRRPQLLDAARELAIDGGIGAVTIGEVAARAGITRSVVYTVFADRAEMIDALLERELEVMVASVLHALRTSGGIADPEEAFVTGFRALLATVEAEPESFRFWISGQREPAVSARIREGRHLVTESATAWIRPAIVRWWDIEDLDAKLPLLIELFLGSCESAIRKYLDGSTGWSAEQVGTFAGRAAYRIFSGA